MVPADAEEGFRVTDRRRRADDGPTGPAAAGEPGGHEAEMPGDARREAAATSHLREESPLAPPGDAGPPHPERNLTGLFVMLAGSAAMALGEAPDPLAGQVQVDLQQAVEIIDLLVLLREKTEGNRTPEESQLLDEIIYDLQVRYVAATRPGGAGRGPSRR